MLHYSAKIRINSETAKEMRGFFDFFSEEGGRGEWEWLFR